jgi:two-component system, NtrC family, nitrogen regulation sensor histidine kinase NtrY
MACSTKRTVNAIPADQQSMVASRAAIGIALRALALGALAYLATRLLTDTHLYATAAVLAVAACAVVVDVTLSLHRLERSFQRLFVGPTAGTDDRPASGLLRGARMAAYEKVAGEFLAERLMQQQQLAYLQSLLDTVTATLIVIYADGSVAPVNRAARRLIGDQTRFLHDSATLGGHAARAITEMTPGATQIVALASAEQVLVSVTQFTTPGSAAQRLVAIQRIAGELGAVEVKAWHDVSRVLAHEIMNSLTPIASLSESLEALARAEISAVDHDSNESSELIGAIEAIKRRSLGLMSFVERYRLVAELPLPEMQVIKAESFMEGIERLLNSSLRERGVRFRCESASPFAFVGDPDQLEQTLINLIRNAADATVDAPQPTVEARCSLRDRQVLFEIADNGSGLLEYQREQIFLPFFSTKTNGSGVGLSIARQVALAHGGQLDFRANTPCGCIFSLLLPAREANTSG